MIENHTFTVVASRGTEYLLAKELKHLQLSNICEQQSAVTFYGTLKDAYKVCLWSRIGIRVLHLIKNFSAKSNEELYEQVKEVDWSEHFELENTFAIDFKSVNSEITHSQYGAQLVKDAIVDQFKERCGDRPSVEKIQPDIKISCFAKNNNYFLCIDLAGESLHRRGYRADGAQAPLKETLAASILQRTSWIETAKQGGAFFDPMCGSGTLLIEAAMIAADIAPSTNREYFGFLKWKQHDQKAWEEITEETNNKSGRFLDRIPPIIGHDISPRAIKHAKQCIRLAGLEDKISVVVSDFTKIDKAPYEKGMLVCNPPYGERVGGDEAEIGQLYNAIGAKLKTSFHHWSNYVFTGKMELADHFGIEINKRYPFYNGPIECRLLQFQIAIPSGNELIAPGDTEGAKMLSNRIKKNLKKILPYLKKENVTCYRVYDADLPEYAAAIDIYGSISEKYAHIQEYRPPKSIDKVKAWSRIQDIIEVVATTFNISKENIFLKQRQKQKGNYQYSKQSDDKTLISVKENDLIFLVNLKDYLDTGLFIDHRITRKWVKENSKGKKFLNLFAYTGSVTVNAAAGGASSTTTVDMSNTYLQWAEKNLMANGIKSSKHNFIRADCLEWIKKENNKYDLIFLDPPTFSNSKKMEDTFDVQRDHTQLIKDTSKLLDKGGVLIFSNNYKGFKIDKSLSEKFNIKDITPLTIPADFKRTPKFHQCWQISKK